MTDLEFLARIKRLTIIALFSDDVLLEHLVLKGGNLLDVVYKLGSRSSIDVDLSTSGDFDLGELTKRITRSLERTFDEQKFVAFDIKVEEKPHLITDDLKDFWGGYDITFK